MKNILFIALATCLFAACQNASKDAGAATAAVKDTAKKMTTAATSGITKDYKVIPGGLVGWSGRKIAGEHTGSLAISEGTLNVTNGAVTGGTFTIDMNSLTCTDLKAGEGKEDLEGHLKSEDFFNVAKHPTSTFTITSVDGNNVTGNLTMIGQTKPVTFPANMDIQPEGSTIQTKAFNINRTDWGLKYGSASFFDGLKDKAINDEITLQLRFKAV